MKNKKIIAGLGIVAILALGSQIEVSPSPLTINEYMATIAIYNYEIQQSGGTLTIQNFKELKDLNDQIRKRVPTDNVEIDDGVLTPAEYIDFRDNLLQRGEKETILEKVF